MTLADSIRQAVEEVPAPSQILLPVLPRQPLQLQDLMPLVSSPQLLLKRTVAASMPLDNRTSNRNRA